jgi:hypothetical protein
LFEAFKLVFNTSPNITIDRGLYAQFEVNLNNDIQGVIKFFFSGFHPLVGSRLIEYLI